MVSPSSDRIPRVPPYSSTLTPFPVQDSHLLKSAFPCSSGYSCKCHLAGPISLAATLRVSFDFLSSCYLDVSVRKVRPLQLCIHCKVQIALWVSPFGYPRINAYSQLPTAFRSVLRPSSPLIAKASTKCSYLSLDSYNINILLPKYLYLSTKNLLLPVILSNFGVYFYTFLPRFFDNTIFSYHTIQLFPYSQCFIASL